MLWHEKPSESSEGVSGKDSKESLADLMEDVELTRAEQRRKRRKDRRKAREERRQDRQENSLEQKAARQETRQKRRAARQQARHERIMNRIDSRKSRAEYGWDDQGNRLNRKERQAAFNEYFDLLAKHGIQSFTEAQQKEEKPAEAPSSSVNYATSSYSFDTPIKTNTDKGKSRETLKDVVPQDYEHNKKRVSGMISRININELAEIAPKILDNISEQELKQPDKLTERRDEVKQAILEDKVNPDTLEEIRKSLEGNNKKRRAHLKRMKWINRQLDSLTKDQLLKVGKMADPLTPEKDLKELNKDGRLLEWLKGKGGLVDDAPFFSFQISEEIEGYIKKNTNEKPSKKSKNGEKTQVAQAETTEKIDAKPPEATEKPGLDEIPDLDALVESRITTENPTPATTGTDPENSLPSVDADGPLPPEEQTTETPPDETPEKKSESPSSQNETGFVEGFLSGFEA